MDIKGESTPYTEQPTIKDIYELALEIRALLRILTAILEKRYEPISRQPEQQRKKDSETN